MFSLSARPLAMQAVFRRSYATISNEQAAARAASTPLAVRIRRLRRRNPPKLKTLDGSDALESGMTPSEFSKFSRDRYKGNIPNDATEEEWLHRANQRRQRIRGFVRVKATRRNSETGKLEHVLLTKPVGEKVYLPNFVIRMMPNHTKKGQPYNPYEATFRMPQSLTKTDLRSYLHAVYGVKTTYIRTDNYIAPLVRDRETLRIKSGGSIFGRYKRATVGLVDPFYYPEMVEDMSATERKEYHDALEATFQAKTDKESQMAYVLERTKKNSKDWEWEGPLTTKKHVILRRIAEARAARERKVEQAKKDMVAARHAQSSPRHTAEA